VRWVLLAADGGSGSSSWVSFVILVFLAWVLSLWLHPYTTCSVCKGEPRHYGAFAAKSWRQCFHCGGTGRQPRFGASWFLRK
jgi:hypothetical protein